MFYVPACFSFPRSFPLLFFWPRLSACAEGDSKGGEDDAAEYDGKAATTIPGLPELLKRHGE
jgi:hypothetical protein